MKTHWCALLMLAAATAPARPPAPAEDLLEFLGSIDTAEEGWTDYLEQTDPDRVAGRPTAPGRAAPPAPQPPTPPPAAASPPPQSAPAKPAAPPDGGKKP